MFSSLKKFLSSSFTREAHDAYIVLVAQARKPWFYTGQAVPDTLDGRFDIIVLHMFVLIHRLRREREGDAGHFIRAISEVFFADMDRSLREMGVGDTGVGKRIKKIVEAFYGRLQAYEQSFADAERFKESLKRNVYRDQPAAPEALNTLDAYARRNAAHLDTQEVAALLKGELSFLD